MPAAARRASYGTREYGYDQFGQLALVKFRNQSDGAWHSEQAYTWDARGRMLAVQVFDPATDALQASLAYSYDTAGGLVRRQAAGQAAERYLLDDQNPSGLTQPVAELDETATHCNRGYTWGGSLIAQHDAATGAGGAARTLYAHSDRLGSARLLTTSDGDAQAGSGFNYDPYGQPLAGADATLTPFAFTGQRGENATPQPLQYHRARWYSPQTANWTSRDTLFDFPGNFGNPYAYAGANPACKSDPSGQFEMGELAAVTAIVGGMTGIDLYGGASILQGAGGRTGQVAGIVMAILKSVGLIALSFVPVVGFFISVAQVPDTISNLCSCAMQVGSELGSLGNGGSVWKAAWGFVQFGLSVLEVLAVIAGAARIIKELRVLTKVCVEAMGVSKMAQVGGELGEFSGVSRFVPPPAGAGGVAGDAAEAVARESKALQSAREYLESCEHPNYKDWQRMRRNRYNEANWKDANGVPKEINHCLTQNDAKALGYPEEMLNDIPSLPMTRSEHQNALGSFHDILTRKKTEEGLPEWFPPRHAATTGEIEKLRNAYKNTYEELKMEALH